MPALEISNIFTFIKITLFSSVMHKSFDIKILINYFLNQILTVSNITHLYMIFNDI